jgi:hypothetical protein
LALLSQRSRWLLAAARNPLRLLLPLRLLKLLRLLLPLRLLKLLLPLRPLRLLMLPLRHRLRRRTDPTGSGMKARAGRDPVCPGFRVSAA